MTTEPQTTAGRALLKREELNSRSFALITTDAIVAIEREAATRARSGLDAGLLYEAIRRTWVAGHDDLRSGLTTDPIEATLAAAILARLTEAES
ncbi:MAG TPA: hypothetical protein VI341_13795 [Actinomycetota bacterium]